MSTVAPAPQLVRSAVFPIPAARAAQGIATRLVPVMLIGSVGALIRFWKLGATFESSDQGTMANLIHHAYGIRWIIAHAYGPAVPILERVFSELFSWLGIPSGEAACRFPVALVSLLQVLITYPFLRRAGAAAREALCGTLCAALLPTLVCDAHFAWGYLTVFLFTGTVALWATMTWLDERRPLQLVIAGAALCLHCLSNVFALGLPMTLLFAWIVFLRGGGGKRQADRGTQASPISCRLSAPALGFLIPCLAALGFMFLSWSWTGQGQIGRLLMKQHHGALGSRLHQLLQLPAFWSTQFGYLFSAVAAFGLIWGWFQLSRPRSGRLGLVALWAGIAAFPLVLLTDWVAMGYPDSYLGAYFIEVVYGAGILGGVLMWRSLQLTISSKFARRVAISAVAAVIMVLGIGTADECLFGGTLAHLTGVHTGWGNVRPDTGIKAAGFYVRENVPADCLILSLHDNQGMEVPLAEYYTGRSVLADCDLKPAMYEAILRAMRESTDVLIVGAAERAWADDLPEMERVCTIRRETRPVRFIYARRSRNLPQVDVEMAVLNARYDRSFRPTRVPLPLLTPPRFLDHLRTYQSTVKELRLRRVGQPMVQTGRG